MVSTTFAARLRDCPRERSIRGPINKDDTYLALAWFVPESVRPTVSANPRKRALNHVHLALQHSAEQDIDTTCAATIDQGDGGTARHCIQPVYRSQTAFDDTIREVITVWLSYVQERTPDTRSDGMSLCIELQNLSHPSPSDSPKPTHLRGW